MQKIIVVGVNWLGDVLFMTPALKAIKNSLPDSYLAVALPERVGRILEHNPIVDEIINFDEKGSQKQWIAKIKFISEIKKKRFNKAIFFHRSFTRTLIFSLAGILEKEGYCRKKTKFLLTKCAPQPDKDSMHKAEFFLNLVRNLGYTPLDLSYEFYVTDDDINKAKEILTSLKIEPWNEKIISLHPGANWPPKRWPVQNYIKLIQMILNMDIKKKILMLGNLKDKDIAAKIKSSFKDCDNISDLTGLTSLGTLGAFFLFSDILVSADSGPLHIACASTPISKSKQYKKVFSIGLYGPTSKTLSAPLSNDLMVLTGDIRKTCKLPCYDTGCNQYICMESIDPLKVFEVIEKRLTF